MQGVIRTCAGYAGGMKEEPGYHALGDHTETVQLDYDPSVLSYTDLLDVFWPSHDPTAKRKTQYVSVILTHDDEQLVAAEQSLAGQDDDTIRTRIEPLNQFWPAEHYHQKYRLRSHTTLLNELREHYSPVQLVASTVASRCNGYVAGFGTMEQLEDEIDTYGLSTEAEDLLRARTGTHTGSHC